MWVAEFKAWHNSHLLRVTGHRDVRVTAYYLNTFRERGHTYINRLVFCEGPDAAKAIEEIAKEPRVKVVEIADNYLVYQFPELKGFHNLVVDRRFIFLKPIIAEKGFNFWTIAALRKKDLLELYKNLKKLKFKATIELLSIREETPRFLHGALLADLTDKQHLVFQAASALGYYAYPRQADGQQLARHLRMPYTTCMEHLRKAEAKVMAAVAGPKP